MSSTFELGIQFDGDRFFCVTNRLKAQCRETHGTKHFLMLKMRHKTCLALRVPNGNQNEFFGYEIDSKLTANGLA